MVDTAVTKSRRNQKSKQSFVVLFGNYRHSPLDGTLGFLSEFDTANMSCSELIQSQETSQQLNKPSFRLQGLIKLPPLKAQDDAEVNSMFLQSDNAISMHGRQYYQKINLVCCVIVRIAICTRV